ncbi:MAG: glycosyltransferase [Ruminococcus flavefaciens]|nr:glycosyltransferase [Ruminococcus flavefaciens]
MDLLTSKPQEGSLEIVLGIDAPWMKTVVCDYKTPLALSVATDRYLKSTEYDIYHANTLWLYQTHAVCKYARKMGKPYVLSTHGMLYPTALAISGWKKKVMRKLWFDDDIMKATCIHATCQQEAEYLREFGYKKPIAVIPNPVVFPKNMSVNLRNESVKYHIVGKKQIGFLGRLHPIKKVENILYAMASLAHEERAQLLFQIIGKYDEQYEQWLRDEVQCLNLTDCVEFVGFVNGKEKYERLAQLDALLVPSTQENFGMIVPEALICETPVYASLGTPWIELNEYNCGWWEDNAPDTIANIIRKILSIDDIELRTMGINGRKLIEEKYEQHKVAKMMLELYQWVINDGEKPKFVYE